MTELDTLLYQRLQPAPPFRYALVGVAADGFRTYSELISEAIASAVSKAGGEFAGLPTLNLPTKFRCNDWLYGIGEDSIFSSIYIA